MGSDYQIDPKYNESIQELDGVDKNSLAIKLAQLNDEMETLQMRLRDEEDRRKTWKEENARRRHNYVPLIFELLKQLAQKNKLKGLYEAAKEKKA